MLTLTKQILANNKACITAVVGKSNWTDKMESEEDEDAQKGHI